jgi:hypothetical protein
MLGVRAVAVAKVADRRDQHWNPEHRAAVHRVVVHRKGEPCAVAMARRATEQADADLRAQSCPHSFPPEPSERGLRPEPKQQGAKQPARSSELAQEQQQKVEPQAQQPAQPEQQPVVAVRPLEQQSSAWAQQVQPASPQLPPAAELPQQELAQPPVVRALARRVQSPGAVEPLWPLRLSLLCPLELSLQPRLLHPRRPEGACEPSRLRPSESSSSASSFLLRRTRATGQ